MFHIKSVVTQIPKVHSADTIVDPALKPETQARREGIPKPIPVIPKPVSQLQRIIHPVLPWKGKEKAGAKKNIIGSGLQPIPQPQPSTAPPSIVPVDQGLHLQPYHP